MTTDPVCGMTVEPAGAPGGVRRAGHHIRPMHSEVPQIGPGSKKADQAIYTRSRPR